MPTSQPTPAYLQALLGREPAPPSSEPPPAPEASFKEVPRTFDEECLDDDALRVIRRLTEAGHEAYMVGGSVRDLIFGLRPKDFDVATSAQPLQVKKLFRNCRIIGRRFRLAHVFFRDKIIEVATFRSGNHSGEGQENGELLIRDDNVFGTAEEDARRRDFTINALLYDVQRRVILDHVGGTEDAAARLVRSIGDPDVRLREDPIRMLRAIRLSTRLGCRIDPATEQAIRRHAGEILNAAAPRIHEDLLRMFSGGAMAPAFDALMTHGLLEVILPELHQHLARSAREGRLEEVEALRRSLRVADAWTQAGRALSPAVRLAILLAPVLLTPLHDAGSRDATTAVTEALRPIGQRLAISRREAERIRQVVLALGRFSPRNKRRRFSVTAFVKRAYFPDALDFFELQARATGDLEPEAVRWRSRFQEVFPQGPPPPRKRAPRRRRRSREHGEKGARTF
ncbi:MAG: polynucleotide adenylyltransferase PcnB [Acidobacteriota bacterium]|nr:polynucleotide adenylyltransferase PcnB [Acidobacteriota bacterium]MDQ7086392.1 polynucleotide adenylyltransferase PcnB [Acidobacteriota bacterium]